MLSTPKAKSGLFLASSLCDGLEDNNIRQVATLLLNKDADPNILIPMHGVTPFHLVIGNDSIEFAEEVTKLFLRHGGDPNVRSNDGMTPVHVAAAWGRINILELLLANGGDPVCLDSDGRSPFHYAFDGKYFKAVTMLAKYCEDIQDDDDEPKYNMVLDKVLVTNGDIIAEYVTSSHDTTHNINTDNASKNDMLLDFYNCKPSFSPMNLESNNMPEIYNNITKESKNISMEYKEDINIKSADLSITNNQMIIEQNNFSQTNNKDILNYSFVDLDFDFANLYLSDVMEKEKCLVGKIINHLSTTLTSDCTINETLQNYKRNKQESSNITSNSDMSFPIKEKRAFYEYKYGKTPKNFSLKLKHNCNKDILKPNTPIVRKKYPRFNTGSISRKKHKKTSDKVLLTPPCILDNSIISMSPNFNTPNHRKKNTMKTPLILSRIHDDDDIISKSPNFTTPVRVGKKKNVEKTSLGNNCLSSKVFKKSHEHKIQTQYSEFNRCKRYIAQSTPRRKKKFIYKLHSGRKRLDCYRQEDNITTDDFIVRNTLKPINLDKTIFSEVAEDATRHNTLNSNIGSLLLNSNESLEMERQNYMPIKLDEGKYDEDDIARDNSDSSQIDLDNNINQMEKKNESIDSFDSDRRDDIKRENEQTNAPFVTIRKNRFKTGRTTETANSATDNIKSTYTTDSLHGESYVDCIECDTKKLLNEDIYINISKSCNLHAKNWCSNRFHKPFPSKAKTQGDLHIPIVNLSVKCGRYIYLPTFSSTLSSEPNGYSVDSKRAEGTYETNLNVHKTERSSSLFSYVTAQEEYKYEDLEEGIVLVERRHCISPFATFSGSECDVRSKRTAVSDASVSTVLSLPKELLIDDVALRRELAQLGDQPGPITNTTRHIYQKRLMYLRSIRDTNSLPRLSAPQNAPKNCADHRVIKPHLEFGDWINHLDTYRSLEKQVFQEFVSPNPSRRWREGMSQTSFNYLLLDPRISQDLQYRNVYLTESEVWSIFLDAIFYIGKGKRSRPFAHLYDAFKVWVSKASISTNKKINRILDIWNNDHGVICLHIFQNVIPVEAYTREAAMIDAIGTENLGNCKGDFIARGRAPAFPSEFVIIDLQCCTRRKISFV
ncbi:uncharacterized protein LOC105192406 [Harpegnathos saltator]|uniref:uncharacterized protein LOC105192406 n=1 Tax=Harpegnathos saltator TaxID=610380 RepID=UPI000948C5F3|nr:uncharacterized protein LOC105192406 [Harpegnathos saltator]XP_025161832.1 uncharacterized protein LOC105192406 [Harpegnathos saltator]